MGLTLTQRKALAIVPKCTGLLSMIGSGIIIFDVLRTPKKRKQTYPRIMLAMSCFDFVTSFMYALSTWPIPADSGVLYASDTTGTCTFQGFFIQLSLAAPMYNLCLAIYYMLVIKYRWSDVKLSSIEKFIHPTILILSFGIAIAGLPLKIYNNANVWCWISNNPSDPNRPINGLDANDFRWAFYYAELWSIIVVVTAIMSAVVLSVVATEKKTSKYAANKVALSKTVKVQALFYVSAFYITWTFPTTLRILQTIEVQVPYAIFLCAVIFTPLQGFFNSIIYLRPRFLRYREMKRKKKLELAGGTVTKSASKYKGASQIKRSQIDPAVATGDVASASQARDSSNNEAEEEEEFQNDVEVALAEANRVEGREEDDDLAANTEEENNQAVLNRGFSAIDDNKFISFMKNFRRKKAVEED